MANREETVTVNVKGNAARAYKEIAKEVGKTRDEVRKAAEAKKRAAQSAQALKVGLAAVVAIAAKAVAQFAENEAAAGRMARVFEQAGASTEELARANKLVEKAQTEYGISAAESSDALRKLMQATGDAQKAEKDYALAVNLAAAENISLTESTRLIADARDGNVRGLQRLSGITKDFATDLQSVEDETRRGDLAIQALGDSYNGAAKELRGTADDLAVFKEAVSDIMSNIGELVVELGTLVRRGVEIATFSEDGALNIRNIAAAFQRFTDAVRETFRELETFASINWSTALEEGLFAAYDEVQNKRARAAAKMAREERSRQEKEGAGAGGFVGPTIDTKEQVAREKEREAAAKREEAESKRRAAKRKANAARARQEAERERQAEAASVERARQEAEQARAEAEEIAFRDEMARLRMRGEERAALEAELRRSDATEGEIELQLAQWAAEDEQRQKEEEDRAREIEQREELARLKMEGRDLEAQLFEIRARNLTPLEEEFALKQALAAESARLAQLDRERNEEIIAGVQAASGLATGIMKQLGAEEEAKRVAAGIDALIYSYKAGAAYAAFNIPQGIAFTAAAISAGAVAAGSGGGGGGSAPSRPSASTARPSQASGLAAAQREERTASMSSGRQAKESNVVINFRSVARPTPEDARQISEAVSREAQTQIGRGRR